MAASAGNGVTIILNNATIQRFKLFGAITYTAIGANALELLGQMSADSNTPFAFAIFATTVGNQNNASFTFVGSPSSGYPVMGSGNVLLYSGWSAFALTVANPFMQHIQFASGALVGSYEIWLMAQNYTSPSVASYLGIGATLKLGYNTNVNIQQVGASDVAGTSVPCDIHSIGGGIMTSNLVDVAIKNVGGTTQTTAQLAVVINDGFGGPGRAAVDISGELSVSSTGGAPSSVYLTDQTGLIPVAVTARGSLLTASGI